MSQHGCPERLSNRSKGFQEDGPSQPTMEVLVETLTGTAFEMTVSPSDTIFAIKSKIFRVEGIPVSQQHLLYNLKELDDSSSLCEHSISDGARLRLVLGMRGGPISTRRLPPPAPASAEPWPDIERLLDSNRDDGDWSSGSGCKVTVLVFRDGERVNMLRVRENRDGTYSPLDHNKYSSSLPQLSECGAGGACGGAGVRAENAVTAGKMMQLRRRMESLSLQRADVTPRAPGEKVEIQKTRSEETLSVPSLLDEPADLGRSFSHYNEDAFASMYDSNYTRYDLDCSFAERYTLLPPIGTRADSDQSVQDSDDIQLTDALAGPILVSGRRDNEDSAILEECLGEGECRLRRDSAENLAPIPAAEYGPLVGGWRGALAPPLARRSRAQHSASALQLRAPPPAPSHPPISDALFSSSTSELEKLKRNSRILPTLSRHRPREHLHLSDEGLHRPPAPPPPRRAPRDIPADRDTFLTETKDKVEVKEKKIRIRCGFCKKRLSIATVHACRCGAQFCAPHRYAEVHGCSYDYKAQARDYLQRANPLVSAPKLPKI